jgi:hypothetical protein
MWRVQRLDQINALKPAKLFDFKSLTLKFRSEQIGRFKTANRQYGDRVIKQGSMRDKSNDIRA